MPGEQEARAEIDRLLEAAGWRVQDVKRAELHAARGVALREFPFKSGYGFADYLLAHPPLNVSDYCERLGGNKRWKRRMLRAHRAVYRQDLAK